MGGGPRGTSVVERLVARHRALGDHAPELVIHVVDPYEPGPGRTWRTSQSRRFLMNTPCLFPTVVPVGPVAAGIPPSPVPLSFDRWRVRVAAGEIDAIPAEDVAECTALASNDFPSRALYGRYLTWLFAELREHTGSGIDLRLHAREVVDALRGDAPGEGPGARTHPWRLVLDDGSILDVDAVVLAVGHVAAAPTPEQEMLRESAARHALQYWPPAAPADVDWDLLPAGEPVLIRGLGLNFFDAMIQLTEGRGGRFAAGGGGRIDYTVSGREPLLVAASRRGVPYRAKAALQSYLPQSITLRHCTPERILAFRDAGIQPGFDHDIWPLLHRDVIDAYYRTLCRTEPATIPAGTELFLRELDAATSTPGPGWEAATAVVVEHHVPEHLRLDVEALGHPFAGHRFEDGEEFDAAVLAYLDADAEGSARGEDDPLKMAIGALNAGRSVIKRTVADGGISDTSWNTELRGWFEPLVEGLASGPPPARIGQLAALVRAGVVRFVGPAPRFAVDREEGVFRASSPWVRGGGFSARALVEAMTPANQVSTTRSPLLRELLRRGTVRARTIMADDGVAVVSAGLDVTSPPYRAVDGTGRVQESVFVIGLQLAAVQWGTAIAAEAEGALDAGGRTLLDADTIAAAILDPL